MHSSLNKTTFFNKITEFSYQFPSYLVKNKKISFPIILLIALLLRSKGFFLPLADHHSWRQTQTAMMSRNFYREGYRLFYPQVDWGGTSPGYIECEFPVYSYVVAVLYRIFGEHDYLGRMTTILCSLLSIYLLYKLVALVMDEKTAIISAYIFSVLPGSIFFSRVFMLEFMMICFCMGAVYSFYRWLQTNRLIWYGLAGVFAALAYAIKIPTLYMGMPLLYLAVKFKRPGLKYWVMVVVLGVLSFIPPILWYMHASYLGTLNSLTVDIWSFGTDKWGNIGVWSDIEFYREVFWQHINKRLVHEVGFWFCIAGLILARKSENKLFYYWAGALLCFFFLVGKGNQIHDYYQLPILPVASFFIAVTFCDFMDKKGDINSLFPDGFIVPKILSVISLIVLISYPFFSTFRVRRFYEFQNTDKLYHAAQEFSRVVPEKLPVVVLDDGGRHPEFLYFSNKKGWSLGNVMIDSSHKIETVKKCAKEGAKYVAIVFSRKNADEDFRQFMKHDPLAQYLLSAYKPILRGGSYIVLKI